jgi:hypothetical protein
LGNTHAVGNFFGALLKDKPWWFSLSKPVNDDHKSCLFYLSGFDQSVGDEFMCLTGLSLVKVGHSQNPNATTVTKSEWDKFKVVRSK